MVSHYTEFSWLIFHVVPHQPITALQPEGILVLQTLSLSLRQLALPSQAFAIEEEFSFGSIGIDKDGSHLTFTARPGPVGQDVQGRHLRIPDGAVEIIAVLGEGSQVDDAEHTAVTGPGIGVVGGRFTQIVITRPHELPYLPVVVLGQGKILIGHVAPGTGLHVITRGLVVGVLHLLLQHHGEVVGTTGTYRTGRLAAKQETLGQHLMPFEVILGAVVESRHIKDGGKTVAQHRPDLVHATGHGTGGVFAVTDILEPARGLKTIFPTL